MSIEKDVENMYKNDIEKRRKNQKKKKKKNLITLLLVIVFIAAIILILNYLGLGFGGGKGEGGESSVNSASGISSEAETTTTTTAVPKEFVSIKVSGSTYIYQGSEITIENLRENIRLMSDNVVVMITDDNATQNAMDDLTAVFEADGREYAIEIPGNSEEGDLSSSEAENIVP